MRGKPVRIRYSARYCDARFSLTGDSKKGSYTTVRENGKVITYSRGQEYYYER